MINPLQFSEKIEWKNEIKIFPKLVVERMEKGVTFKQRNNLTDLFLLAPIRFVLLQGNSRSSTELRANLPLRDPWCFQ